jgi:hypothetical protein
MRPGKPLDAQFCAGDFKKGLVFFRGDLQRGRQQLGNLAGRAPFIGFDFTDGRYRTAHPVG